MNKKIVPIVLIVVGATLLVAALIFSLETATSTEPAGLGEWIFKIFGVFLGAGTGIKGWLDLRKAQTISQNQRTQESVRSPDSEQVMEGKGGTQKQKSTDSPRSKQTMK